VTVCDHDVIERAHNRKELREKIADIIVRKVLQEDYDDMVEGYLNEILLAADQIILLPAYKAVTQAYYDRLASPVVPVGREVVEAAQRIRNFALAYEQVYEDGDLIKDADAILAALGTKGADTGREDETDGPGGQGGGNLTEVY